MITYENALSAITDVDRRGIQTNERSSTYDLIYNAKRYPPKLIYSLAHKYQSGQILDRATFSGGEDSHCFSVLRKLGFIIERKDFVFELLKQFIKQAKKADSQKTADYPKKFCNLDINVSFGQGNFSKVPFISFLGYDQKTQKGIYPTYLYYPKPNILLLVYGISTDYRPEISWGSLLERNETVEEFLSNSFNYTPERYGGSYVYNAYTKNDIKPTFARLYQDLDRIILEFHDLMGGKPKSEQFTKNDTGIKMKERLEKNLIYYGPPGTGKTYKTMEKAVAICDGEVPEERSSLVKRYHQLEDENRISFVTFHQSYSYEDFVEGIRPTLDGLDEKDEDGAANNIQYECRPGVFRNICSLAKSDQLPTKVLSVSSSSSIGNYDFDENTNIWKMSLGNTLDPTKAIYYDECIKENFIYMGYGKELDFSTCDTKNSVLEKLRQDDPNIENNDYNINSIHTFKNLIKKNDLIIVSDGNLKFRAIGQVLGDYVFKQNGDWQTQTRAVRWLIKFEESQPYEKILNRRFSQKTLYQLSHNVLKIDRLKKLLSNTDDNDSLDSDTLNYVLIIDEINRGNIAKIFGELITLIEDDKRDGMQNELAVKLPYSGDLFSVPDNVYIIATMNTADRSIALLDTALRRRFKFEELMPNLSVIKGDDGNGNIKDGEGGGINLRELLQAINQRIQFMLDRDHTIGHAYFIKIKDFNDLRDIISQQIIPLLQEYFYEDWHRIQLVFADIKDGDEKNEPQIIQNNNLSELDILGFDHEEYEDGKEYRVTPHNEISPKMVRKIYRG